MMLALDQVIEFSLTAGEVQTVLAGLSELPFKFASPVIDKIRARVLEIDPTAFSPVQQPGTTVVTPPPMSNGAMS